MAFLKAMEDTLNEEYNYSRTENGALGYRTSGKALLDLNFAVASLRSAAESVIDNRFKQAFFEDRMLAMRWLFFARDREQGLGERRLFRTALAGLVNTDPQIVIKLIPLVAEYGRWDDLWVLLDSSSDEVMQAVYKVVDEQLYADMKNMMAGKPVSLLAKWMPSINASSAVTKKHGKQLCKALGLTERDYRKMLSDLRKYLDVVETKMSAKDWSKINYEAVPSRANLVYNDAFLRNDETRRRQYLGQLEKGEVKINASVLYPHDIVHKYTTTRYYWESEVKPYDAAIEALWKALPDTVQGLDNTIVVADGSGSMNCNIGNTKTTALEVANALAIYFAERSSGEFKDKYITFSERPQLVDLSKGKSLHDKLEIALQHNECANTNIEAVFNLILTTAIKNDIDPVDMPKNILIISDMEFDSCATTGAAKRNSWGGYESTRPDERLFKMIERNYRAAGYQLPRLVFWNVNSRTGTIPVKENELGVALVSGFSVNIAKMVMSGKLDPYECLLETINSKRYDAIEEALRK